MVIRLGQEGDPKISVVDREESPVQRQERESTLAPLCSLTAIRVDYDQGVCSEAAECIRGEDEVMVVVVVV